MMGFQEQNSTLTINSEDEYADNDQQYDSDDDDSNDQELYLEVVTIRMGNVDSMKGSNQLLDYTFRSNGAEFDSLSLWEYMEQIRKITKSREAI